ALKPQLRALLAQARVETGDFLRTLPRIDEPALAPGQNSSSAGEIIGPYRLLRQIGSGGMGSVWLAERTDGLMKRPVALKLPHYSYDTARRAGLVERLARERDILATLNHPNIATLYDAGIADNGQPYLAIEYVEGLPIDEYCRERHVDLKSRLGLFVQIANAVAYAHAKLALHRDLKPANILVTADAQVRLLDFGIAKLMDEGQASETRLTELSGRALTPDYASPEQILGEPLTIASDVYSLGVILYELLSGQRPYKLRRESRGALEEAIVQAEPLQPSNAANTTWHKSLRGDLDTIVLKALKKVPAERYATVNAFVDDVTRFLSDRPVLAQPDSISYRLRKFVARNTMAVAAALLMLLVVIGGAGIAIWQTQVATAERDRAEAVKSLVTSMFVNADPYSNGGKALSAVDLLMQAEREFRAKPIRDARVRGEIANVLARSLFRLNEDALSERLTADALADAQQSLNVNDPSRLRLTILAAEQRRYRGDAGQARSLIEAALVPLRAAQQSLRADFVNALAVKSAIAVDAVDYGAALDAAREAVAAGRRLLPPGDPLNVTALTALGVALHMADDPDAALTASQQAVQLAQRVVGSHSQDLLLIDARVAYAKALGAKGQYGRAADELEAVVRNASALHGAQSVEVGLYLQNAAGLQLRAGRIRSGIDSAARAVAIRVPAVDDKSFESIATRDVYAHALLLGRRAADALPILTGLQQDISDLMGPDNLHTLEARADYALALAWTGALSKATTIADGAIADAERAKLRATHQPWHVRAIIARLSGDARAAIVLESKALEMTSATRNAADHAEVLAELGAAQFDAADRGGAERSLLRALALLDECGHVATPVRAVSLVSLAKLRLAQGRAAEALKAAHEADAFWNNFDPVNHGAGEAASWLGRAQLSVGLRTQGRATLARAHKILAQAPS
ncbi:MAG: serine/threonine-protein kinase, partial [Steroidobacteraceae bacterium]